MKKEKCLFLNIKRKDMNYTKNIKNAFYYNIKY